MTDTTSDEKCCGQLWYIYLRIDRKFCSVHEEVTSIRLCTLDNPRSGLRKDVYNLIKVISYDPNK